MIAVLKNWFRAPALVFVAVLSAAVLALPAAANPISNLPGRWTGWGAVTLSNGATERVKCVATYFVEKGGAVLRQNLRCSSTAWKVDSVTELAIAGGSVSGSWNDRTRSNTGSVSGSMTAKGFRLTVAGDGFSASASLTTGKCKQSISFAPTGLEISRISIGLRKC